MADTTDFNDSASNDLLAAIASVDGGYAIAFRRVSDIEAKPIRWLWLGRIARGKITMLAGHPGLGKSQVTVSMAAVVTTGGIWPVDRSQCERGSVIILSAEDDPEDTIRPRLEAAGADLSRCYIVDAIRERNNGGAPVTRFFNLALDIERLGDLARQLSDVALIVIDPITAYLGGVDSHKNADVRGLLAPLAAMAAEHEVAIVCVSHLTKAGGTEAMLRVMGSLGFVAAARGAYLIAKDQEDDKRRLFLPMKNNLAEDMGGLAFRVRGRDFGSGIVTSCVEWDSEPVTMTADEALAVAGNPEEQLGLEDAVEWLRKLLVNGPVDSKEIHSDAKQSGIAWRTVERAKPRLGVKANKSSFAGGWRWSLPDHSDPEDDPNPPTTQYIGGLGGLRDSESLKPSCGAGFPQDRQVPKDDCQNQGIGGLGGLREKPCGTGLRGDRDAQDRQDRQGVGDGGLPDSDPDVLEGAL